GEDGAAYVREALRPLLADPDGRVRAAGLRVFRGTYDKIPDDRRPPALGPPERSPRCRRPIPIRTCGCVRSAA
ncbi:hypothetical protein, partial [Actinomadura sp. HBU206391]|uniref:hypothetical protein n=1 Tax=Actinomadura sp. HBU206391 TaxID=2731692 RepID=UPI001C9D4F69